MSVQGYWNVGRFIAWVFWCLLAFILGILTGRWFWGRKEKKPRYCNACLHALEPDWIQCPWCGWVIPEALRARR